VSTDPLNIGLSGLEAASTQIDVSANNVANVGTAGFQGQTTEFEDIFAGAVAARISTNTAPGGLDPTGVATNLAISGPGFFVLAGTNGSPTYTRSGNFSVNANGDLADASSGLTVANVNGGAITVPSGATGLAIGADGNVTVTLASGQSATLGRVALATFQNPGGLLHAGGGYQASITSGNVLIGAPATPGYGSLIPGFLESSNVDLADEMIKMIASQAAFEANAKSVRTGDQMLKTAVNIDTGGKTA
jgi:flagellar hook protein FlgE